MTFNYRVLELFSGTESFSNVAESKGFETFTVDIDKSFNPDLVHDVNELCYEDLPRKFREAHIVWCSPPCKAFSVASIGKHWNKKVPSETALNGMQNLSSCFRFINLINPQYWFIENPRGMMRKLGIMKDLPKYTVTYCQYGYDRMKPTDIWTNLKGFEPKMCSNGDGCHVSAPRGSITGTQGRSREVKFSIPNDLCKELLDLCEDNLI